MGLEFNLSEIIGTRGVKFLKMFGEFHNEKDTFEFKVPRIMSGVVLLSLAQSLVEIIKEEK